MDAAETRMPALDVSYRDAPPVVAEGAPADE